MLRSRVRGSAVYVRNTPNLPSAAYAQTGFSQAASAFAIGVEKASGAIELGAPIAGTSLLKCRHSDMYNLNPAILAAYAQEGLTYAASVGAKGADLAAGAIEHAAPVACKVDPFHPSKSLPDPGVY